MDLLFQNFLIDFVIFRLHYPLPLPFPLSFVTFPVKLPVSGRQWFDVPFMYSTPSVLIVKENHP